MADTIDKLFGENEEGEIVTTYPGSTKRVRDHSDSANPRVLPASDPIFKAANWGKPTIIEVIPDHPFTFYRPNVFAKIIGKSGPTLKFWEQNGFVPKPPFRFRYDSTVRNYYDEASILAFLRLLNDRGQLTETRIDWASFPELPGEIAKAWAAIRLDFSARVKQIESSTDR